MSCRLCVVMAGGRASRLGFVNKPMLKICGEPMIERILRVCDRLCTITIVVVSSYTASRDLAEVVNRHALAEQLYSAGCGYVEDLATILRIVRKPALVLPSDVPFVTVESLEFFIDIALKQGKNVVTMCVECLEPLGISVFTEGDGGEWCCVCVPRSREFLNINTPRDVRDAEEYCREEARGSTS